MPQETELKLAVHPKDLPRLLAHPLLTASAPHTQHLRNTYFDTADLSLMQRRMAVRERQTGARTLLTVKTAGQSVGGLSRRGEWEAPCEPGQFDFATLVDDPALSQELSALAGQLLPVFQTDFVRRSWLLPHAGARVEVALDEGHISSTACSGAPSEAILELELELKQGPALALFELALAFSEGPDDGAGGLRLRPSDRSKAERGYALFRDKVLVTAQAFSPAARPAPPVSYRATAMAALGQLQSAADHAPASERVAATALAAVRRQIEALSAAEAQLPAAFVSHWRHDWDGLATSLERAPGKAAATLDSVDQSMRVLRFMRDLMGLPDASA